MQLRMGSATDPVAAVGVPPAASGVVRVTHWFAAGGQESFRPEAENGGRDARAPQQLSHSG